MVTERIKNDLEVARRGRGLSRKEVSYLLGKRGTSAVATYERGVTAPPLETALKLEIVYRRPVAFLWPQWYGELRSQVRALEEKAKRKEEGDAV